MGNAEDTCNLTPVVLLHPSYLTVREGLMKRQYCIMGNVVSSVFGT